MTGAARRWVELSARLAPALGATRRGDPASGQDTSAWGHEEAASLIVEAFIRLGGRAAEERDGWLVTHLPAPAGVDTAADLESFRQRTRDALRGLTGLDAIELRADLRAHEDWSETWKRGLAPRQVTERILVRPSWIEAPRGATGVTIVLDPGMAFGTAEHGTTRGSLRLLDRALRPGDRVLDVGAGSGILAIAAALLGAPEVVAIEGDPLASETLVENLRRNEVEERVRCVERYVSAEDLVEHGPASGIVANIESGVLRPLMGAFARTLAPGGWLVLSGILEHEWDGMRDVAENAGFRFMALDEDGEWRSGWFQSA